LESGVAGMIGVRRWHFDSKIVEKFYPHHFRMGQYNLPFLINHVQIVLKKAVAKGKIKVKVEGIDTGRLGRPIKLYHVALSKDPADGLLYLRGILGFDKETGLPALVEVYDFDNRLYKNYVIRSFVSNPRIDDSIFEIKK